MDRLGGEKTVLLTTRSYFGGPMMGMMVISLAAGGLMLVGWIMLVVLYFRWGRQPDEITGEKKIQ